MTTIQQALAAAEALLAEQEAARLEAEILLCHCLGESREFCYTHPQHELAPAIHADFNDLVSRRLSGEPVAYITGSRDFWDLQLEVNPHVLIPRPETELLVEAALETVSAQAEAYVADLGTGSGAIAIALARARPRWRVTAVDVDSNALQLAQRNAEKHGVQQIDFRQDSWCDGLEPAALDLIIANPPYVAAGDPHLQEGDLRFEPNIALQAAESGFADLFAIAATARDHLKPGASLLLEHGEGQHQLLWSRLEQLGYTAVQGRRDLSGHWRMVQAQLPPA